ncbi:tRNA (adenosine(37)-N6)-threonylcarbamoyltransferase complex ATPase subunit type 1 TsaE [Chloroflexota bacterium]
MSHFNYISYSTKQTQELGARIGKIAKEGDVLLLNGNLGAGKTCLTQGIARGLGIKEHALSPSFMLVRELYGRLPLYHIDLYRLNNLAEITDLGLDEYLYGNGICVVEWAEKGISLLPAEHLLVKIEHRSETERSFSLQSHGKRYADMLKLLNERLSSSSEANH